MGTIMKKKYLVFIFIAMLLMNLCGCVVSQENSEQKEVSVSGDGEKQGKKDQSQGEGISSVQITNPFVTKNCIYEVDEYGEELIQKDLQGKKIKSHKVPAGSWGSDEESIWISEEHICYKPDEELLVSPILQTDEGEEISWKEKEKIAGDVEVVCILEPYLIYIDDTVYRYDFRTKESKPLGDKGEYDSALFYKNYWIMPIIDKGKLYFSDFTNGMNGENETLYCVDIEEWKAEEVSSAIRREDLFSSELAGIKDSLLCMIMKESGSDKEIDAEDEFMVCFDTEANTETVLQEKEVFDLLEKEKLWEKDNGEYHKWVVLDTFQYDNRTYLVMDLEWTKNCMVDFGPDKGKETQVWPHRTILLSCPLDNIKELSYEKEISDWLYSRADRTMDLDEEDAYEEFALASIYTLYQGELYMGYSDDKGDHMVAYSMKTGEYREVSKEETAYYLFGNDSLSE